MWKQDEIVFMFCVCTAVMDKVTDVGWTAFLAAVKANTSITTLKLDCTCDHCSQLYKCAIKTVSRDIFLTVLDVTDAGLENLTENTSITSVTLGPGMFHV